MKAVAQLTKLSVVLCGLLIALPQASLADKGGKPNKKSVASTAACITADGSAQVYSCKGLSNVVLWCGTSYIKYDDLDAGGEIYEGVFDCGDADGEVSYVAIKSGSQKHKGDTDVPPGAPKGSGLFVNLTSCPLQETQIPTPGNCDVDPVVPGGAAVPDTPDEPDDPIDPGVPIGEDDPPNHTGG